MRPQNRTITRKTSRRRGAIVILVVIMLPVLILLSAIAINIAHVQLARTQLKIATDAAARAGGRAWSFHNDREIAAQTAIDAAAENEVQGVPLVLARADVEFGESRRPGDVGRFRFSPVAESDAAFRLTNAVRVTSNVANNLPFQVSSIDSINLATTAVASQVNRDIALVVDRSGSMAYFEDEDFMYNHIKALFDAGTGGITSQEFDNAVADYQPIDRLADMSLNSRHYADSVLNQLTGDLREYAETVNSDYRKGQRAPRQSRWAVLEQSTTAFFDMLIQSPAEERISVSSFASDSTLDLKMTFNLQRAKQTVLKVYPTGSTAIGLGMETAVDELLADRRTSAIPTILIFSDGVNKKDPSPINVARDIMARNPLIVINTVTFADGDQVEMAKVAEIGNGKHYHAVDGDDLVDVFREIAFSFSTVLTE